MSTLHHTKLQVDGPSGQYSKLHLHPSPEVPDAQLLAGYDGPSISGC